MNQQTKSDIIFAIVIVILWVTLLLIPRTTCSQPRQVRKPAAQIARYSLPVVAGLADGLKERISYHYYTIPESWNADYWNPQISWRNKWENGDPAQGEAFPLSSTSLVFLTDGYHMLRTVNRWAWISKATITIAIGQPRAWYWYLIDMAASWTGFVIGYHITYK